MESPFTEMPLSISKPYSQWDNEDEIMMKNPLLNPGQTQSSETEFSFENISRGVDEYFSNEFETKHTEENKDEYKKESSVDNELASYETDLFNKEAEIEYDVPPIPGTISVASPSCDISIAVTPFQISQTQKIDPDLLSPLKNKRAIEWNRAFLSKIKIDPKDVLTDLQRYVDLAFVKNAIDAYNKSHSSAMIDAGTAPINAIFAEAVHQFQKKIYFNASSIDGNAGPGTLHSLGIISFPQDSKKLAANDSAKKELKDLKIKVLINGTECNYINWFSFTYNPSFLGKSFNRPVHYLLIKQLRIAESYLLNSARFKGDNLIEMGSKLGLSKDTEEHAGGRLSGGGMHVFGLALDINHNNNPWIGAGWVKKPKKEIYDKLSEPKRKRLDTVLNEKYKILEDLKKASGQKLYGDKISVYLDHVGQTKGADTNDAYKELKQRNDEFIAYLKANPSQWSYWKKSATFEHGSSINGFLNLDQELVYALRQIGNLGWGAIDFGPGEGADGDMMHFDMRTLPIGRKINLCKSNEGGDPLKTHPYLKGAIDKKAVCAIIEKEEYLNNENYENWNESESVDFEDESKNFLNNETAYEADINEITDEFDEAYEGEIEEAYEGESDGEFSEETEMDFEEINDEEELNQEPEIELEEDMPPSTEIAINNEYTVDEKKGITGYLNVSAIKNSPLRTGVFIPAGFTQSNKTDVIVYLHGLFDYGSYKYGMAYYWKNYSNIREYFYLGNRNAILIAAALGSNPQVTDLIFKYQKGLDQFLSDCIKELIARNYLSAGTVPGKIILAAHSAGGYPMSAILRTENNLIANIDECWCFDCFYNYQWEKVLEKNTGIPFYHYWAYTNNGKMSGPGLRAETLAKSYRNIKNIQPATGIHHREVIEYAWKNEINKRSWFTPTGSGNNGVAKEMEYFTEEFKTSSFEKNSKAYEFIAFTYIRLGYTENAVVNLIFKILHPELGGRKLQDSDPKSLKQEWIDVKSKLVTPIFKKYMDVPPLAYSTDKVPAGFTEGRYKTWTGLDRKSAERIDEAAKRLNKTGKLNSMGITDADIDTFQRIANAETGGHLQNFYSYDMAIISMGFRQFTFIHKNIYDWINKAPLAFKKYGIETDTSLPPYKIKRHTTKNGEVKEIIYEVPRIKGVDDPEILRWNGWAQRFYYAGLDDDIVIAEFQLGKEFFAKELGRLQTYLKDHHGLFEMFMSYYNQSPHFRAMFHELNNAAPSRVPTVVLKTLNKASQGQSADQFIEIFRQTAKGNWPDPEQAQRIFDHTK